VDPLRSALRQQQASQERRYREVLDRYAQEKGKAQERARLLSRQAELQVIDKHRRDAAARLERQQRERRALMSQLVDLRDQRYQLRLAVAQRLNEQLFPVIRVRVEQCGNTDEYRSLLSDAMRNSGLRYGSLVERAVTRIPPDDLATIVRTDDVEGLVEHLGVDRDRAMKFIAQLRDHRMLHEIETVELHDRPTIELKDGEQYKDSTMLSTGQKCTAILPILLLESEAPLLIDQPEDNLDNAFVFDTIVKSVLKAKSGRQLIFVTHNPNIPVLGDAERVFVMASDGTTATVSAAGTVDDVRADIERLLEGGRDAFQRRMERYGY
jgi:ABC-type dipeptide/oligopeptide/nickel transport system ATPase component